MDEEMSGVFRELIYQSSESERHEDSNHHDWQRNEVRAGLLEKII